jgi:hypothetical protein
MNGAIARFVTTPALSAAFGIVAERVQFAIDGTGERIAALGLFARWASRTTMRFAQGDVARSAS